MLQKQALKFANEIGITIFSRKYGWKDTLKKTEQHKVMVNSVGKEGHRMK